MNAEKLTYFQEKLRAGARYRIAFPHDGLVCMTIGSETITEVDSELLLSIDISQSMIIDGPSGMVISGPIKLSLL